MKKVIIGLVLWGVLDAQIQPPSKEVIEMWKQNEENYMPIIRQVLGTPGVADMFVYKLQDKDNDCYVLRIMGHAGGISCVKR